MPVYKLTLADEDGVVISQATISTVLDFDLDDIDAEGEYDYYHAEDYTTTHGIGSDIEKEIDIAEGRD